MTNIVHVLVQKAITLGVIEDEKADIYEYGLEDFLYSLFTWIVFLIAGLVIGMFWQMLLFMVVHIPLRIHAGGIHCSTRLRCFFVSSLITVVVFALPVFFAYEQLAVAILFSMIPNILLIKFLAPVEDVRKPLNEAERSHYGKVSFAICIIEIALIISFFFILSYETVYLIGIAISVVSVQLVFSAIKNFSSKNYAEMQLYYMRRKLL